MKNEPKRNQNMVSKAENTPKDIAFVPPSVIDPFPNHLFQGKENVGNRINLCGYSCSGSKKRRRIAVSKASNLLLVALKTIQKAIKNQKKKGNGVA